MGGWLSGGEQQRARHRGAPKGNLTITACAIIQHTQGASEYAFISLAAIALRAKRELPGMLHVQMPMSLRGLRLDMLYTAQSLAALSDYAGFKWLYTHNDCQSPDAVISDHVAVHENKLLTHNHHVSFTRGRHGSDFLQSMWAILRAAAAAKHGATDAGARVSLRIIFVLLTWTPGPLAHAHALLREETLSVLSLLEPYKGVVLRPGWHLPENTSLAPSVRSAMQSALHEQAQCAYLYLRAPVSHGHYSFTVLNRTTSFSSDRSFRSFKLADDWVATKTPKLKSGQLSIEHVANAVAPLVRRAGLACVRINALLKPDSSALLDAFARVDGRLRVRVAELVGLKPQNAAHEARWKHKSSDASQVLPNVRERYLAYAAPLLITELGTHWSDFVLAKRVRSGLASAVLEVPAGQALVESRWVTASTHANCSFYRSLCCQSWIPAMDSESHICHPPPSLEPYGRACQFLSHVANTSAAGAINEQVHVHAPDRTAAHAMVPAVPW
jgi:hypothetical protein